jgi:hypothetical protein
VADGTPKKILPMSEAGLKSLCRSFTEANVKKLSGFAHAKQGVEPEIQLRAIGMLMDRGWGKPNQPHDAKLDGELRITIRKLLTKEDDDNQ